LKLAFLFSFLGLLKIVFLLLCHNLDNSYEDSLFASILKVDERAVLKHFDWPEKKADTLREAAFGYRDLKKLESEVSSYKDDPRLPCDIALKKMVVLSEK
jgi:hypothetical protein